MEAKKKKFFIHIVELTKNVDNPEQIIILTREHVNTRKLLVFYCDNNDRDIWYDIFKKFFESGKRMKITTNGPMTAHSRDNIALMDANMKNA